MGVDTIFRLDGRRALVTGASGGLGAHFARTLHAAGAEVVLAARRVEACEALAAEMGPRASALRIDVADAASVATAVAGAHVAYELICLYHWARTQR